MTPSTYPSPSAGSRQPKGSATTELAVTGMHCGSCVALVEESLAEQHGVRESSVDLDAGRAVVRYDPALLGVDDLCAIVAEAGYSATPVG
jgi:P-type Cu+ transporter